MKIRSGFVSNSSSSSFIVGIGKVTNLRKLRKYFKTHGIEESKFDVYTAKVGELPLPKYAGYCLKVTDAKITVESFQSDASINRNGLGPSDTVVIVNIMNNEGDCGLFSWDEDNGINYDIGLDDFSETQQKIVEMFSNKESGIDTNTASVDYGAGRNG